MGHRWKEERIGRLALLDDYLFQLKNRARYGVIRVWNDMFEGVILGSEGLEKSCKLNIATHDTDGDLINGFKWQQLTEFLDE